MLQIGNKEIKQMNVGNTSVKEVYLGSELVWPSGPNPDTDWYGVRFEGSSTTGTRTGNLEYHKSLPVQSLMKGCTIDADGTVKYLNPTDWTKYEDGTPIDDTLNVMVEIPDFGLQFISGDGYDEIRISPYYLPGYAEMHKQYVSAYEAYNDSSVLKSKKGVLPTINVTRANFQTYARANGNTHWNMYTQNAHKCITWLFVVEYANRNCQAAFNDQLTTEGYHQGGLGNGVTTGVVYTIDTHNTVYNYVPTGTTDSLGNSTGVVEYTTTGYESNRTVSVPRYRGIENPFGHIWKNVIDVIVTGTTNDVYICTDYNNFGNTASETNNRDLYTKQDFNVLSTNSQWVTKLVGNNAGDLFPLEGGGSSSTYYCDYSYTNATSSDRTLLIGGNSDIGSSAGLFYYASPDGVGGAYADIGTRLTYLI